MDPASTHLPLVQALIRLASEDRDLSLSRVHTLALQQEETPNVSESLEILTQKTATYVLL